MNMKNGRKKVPLNKSETTLIRKRIDTQIEEREKTIAVRDRIDEKKREMKSRKKKEDALTMVSIWSLMFYG